MSEPELKPAPVWQEWAIRVAGAMVGIWGGVLLAWYGAFLTPLRLGMARMPVSLVLAIGGNLLLIWFTYRTTRNTVLALVPGLVWVGLSFVASGRTTEGDLVLVDNNWVSALYLLSGSLTIGIAAYRMVLARR